MSSPAAAEECITDLGASATASGNSLACGNGAVATGGFFGGATAVGIGANATADVSTAIGFGSIASGTANTALGNGATASATELATALGSNAIASHNNSVALGANTATTATNQVAVGGRVVTQMLDGAIDPTSLDAINGRQINSIVVAQDTRDDGQDAAIAALGSAGMYVDVNSTGAAASATGTDAIAIGGDSTATATGSVAIGEGASAVHANSVAIGSGTTTLAANQVNVGGRTISSVTAGTLSATSSEAVNGSQLFATNTAVSALDGRVDALEILAEDFDADLRRLDNKVDGSTAVAIAMGGNAFLPNKAFNLTANVGAYGGAIAGALQLGAMLSPNAAVNAGLAKNLNKTGKLGARVGVTFGW